MKIEPRMRFDNLLRKTLEYYDNLGHLTQQEERTMNDNPNTNTTTFKPVPATPLTDEDFAKLLETKSLDGETLSFINGEPIAYVTDADEATDEPTPTIH